MYRFCLLLSLLIASAAQAAPRGVTRVVRTFDFEERKLGNAEDIPMRWVKVEGPGFPHYVNGRLSSDRAHSGSYSFRFDLNGGSLLYRYPSGLLPIQIGAHYHVEAYVQTTALPNAKARITAYFTDADGHPLIKTVDHSALYAASEEGRDWKRLSIDLPADDPGAAFLVLELELLQPAQYSDTKLGNRALFAQDIRGSAWFDDVSVSQIPRVTMSTDRPGNVFRRDDPLQINVMVSDRFTDDLTAQFVVKDADDRIVYQRSGGVESTAPSPPAPGFKALAFAVPGVGPGWYETSLAMSSGGKFLCNQTMDVVILPDDAASISPDPRFGIIATDLPFGAWKELPALLPMLSVGRVKLALWSKAGDIQQMDGDVFDRLLTRLAEQGITPTACLVDLPPKLSERLRGGSWPALLQADPSIWRPDLSYLLARYANHLDRWQMGADFSDIFAADPVMRKAYAAVQREFAELVHDPDLAMPWPASYEMVKPFPAAVAMSIPTSVLPYQIPLYMKEFPGIDGQRLSLSFEILDRDRYGRTAQFRDFAQRAIYALSAGATRIDFPLPFAIGADAKQTLKQPREILMPMRTIISVLGSATFKGRIPIADGVEAFLFDRDGRGIVALWSKGDVNGQKTLAMNLGQQPMCVDLWGNVTALLSVPGNKSPNDVQLTVGPMPMFLIGIDAPQAQLRASVSIDQPMLESSFQSHVRRIRFVNPYKTLLSGTVKLKAPNGWTLNPPTFVFSLNPGDTFDQAVTLSFPYNSFAGPKPLDCIFTLQGLANNNNFTVPLTLTLGLSDVGMQSIAIRDGNDVIVQQMISNYGEKSIDYTAFVTFPGQPRQERLITQLGTGTTVIKRYRFRDVHVTEHTKVRVGVKELLGVRVLNEELSVQ
jgi:hypothetical protein